MKKDIHPTYYSDAKVICACGNTFITGATLPELHTELCSKCHPFFTGTQKLIDTARRVDKFQKRVEKGVEAARMRKGKKAKTAKRVAAKKTVPEKTSAKISSKKAK